jgi:hypothetical protein
VDVAQPLGEPRKSLSLLLAFVLFDSYGNCVFRINNYNKWYQSSGAQELRRTQPGRSRSLEIRFVDSAWQIVLHRGAGAGKQLIGRASAGQK